MGTGAQVLNLLKTLAGAVASIQAGIGLCIGQIGLSNTEDGEVGINETGVGCGSTIRTQVAKLHVAVGLVEVALSINL